MSDIGHAGRMIGAAAFDPRSVSLLRPARSGVTEARLRHPALPGVRACERVTSRPVATKFRGRWLEEERATRNEAPTRRRGKQQSLRRLRRIYPEGAQFCFGELPAAGKARGSPIGRVVWPCHSSSPGPSASFRTIADFDRFESHISPSSPGLSRRPRLSKHGASRTEVAGTSPATTQERWQMAQYDRESV